MTSSHPTVRSLALTILGEVLHQDKYAAERLDHYLTKSNMPDVDRALLTQLVYGVLRDKGYLDHVLEKYTKPSKTPPAVNRSLLLAIYQLIDLDRVPEHAAVFESVEMVKRKFGDSLASLVNAVLRKVIREREVLKGERQRVLNEETKEAISGKHQLSELSWALSIPSDILGRWFQRMPAADVIAWLKILNGTPPLYLRLNERKGSREEICRQMADEGMEGTLVVDKPIVRLGTHMLQKIAPFLERGYASVQDLASFRVVETLAARSEETGIDVCAGHGGKASALVERMAQDPKNVYVHDVSAAKLRELEINFSRLGLRQPQRISGPEEALRQNLSFDWILMDAPCSGMGTLGRKPEIRWRRPVDRLQDHAIRQWAILKDWSHFLKPGGRLVYAVCSLEPEEGPQLISRFLREHDDFIQKYAYNTFSCHTPQDGFYVSELVRKS